MRVRPEVDEAIRARWLLGKTSTNIARELFLTRNAVIGRLSRMGLFRNRPKKASDVALAPRPRAPFLADGGKRDLAPDDLSITPVAVHQLASHHCRWPTHLRCDDGLTMYCGNRKNLLDTYCPAHLAVAYPYGPPGRRTRGAARV